MAQNCQYHHCTRPAFGFCMLPSWVRGGQPVKKFFCKQCWDGYVTAWRSPASMATYDQAPLDDIVVEDWLIALRGWTPAQVEQIKVLRRMRRAHQQEPHEQ